MKADEYTRIRGGCAAVAGACRSGEAALPAGLGFATRSWGGDAMTQRIVVLVAAACFFLVIGFVLWWR